MTEVAPTYWRRILASFAVYAAAGWAVVEALTTIMERNSATYNVSEIREFNVNRGNLQTSGVDTHIHSANPLPADDGRLGLEQVHRYAHVRHFRAQLHAVMADGPGFLGRVEFLGCGEFHFVELVRG